MIYIMCSKPGLSKEQLYCKVGVGEHMFHN